ncbi:hypothetical protein ACFLTP_09935 [Chloroflexota bacterium]
MRCVTHPEVETNLRCGKCGNLICPRCMVQTPVGARCTQCAQLCKLPTFQVSAKYYLRAIGAGLGISIISGLVWGTIDWVIPVFSFNLLLAPAAGYAIGEVTSLSVNRKRSTGLAIVGSMAVTVAYVLTFTFPGGFPIGLFHILYQLLALALGIWVAVTRLR